MHKPSKNAIVRWLWTGLGSIFVVFAAIGTIVPGWPTTSWLVAAGFCFGRSSRRMFRWLLTNRIFGNALLEYYKAGRALPLHSKIVIIGIISLVSAFSIYVVTKTRRSGIRPSNNSNCRIGRYLVCRMESSHRTTASSAQLAFFQVR